MCADTTLVSILGDRSISEDRFGKLEYLFRHMYQSNARTKRLIFETETQSPGNNTGNSPSNWASNAGCEPTAAEQP